MADAGVKKVIIKKEDLPAFNGNTQQYSVRYRIVSEDKNRYSHWSPYYSVAAPTAPTTQYSTTITNSTINVVWSKPTGSEIKNYYVYFKINGGEWLYIAATTSTQFSTLLENTVSTIQVAVQVPTYPKSYFASAALFTSPEIEVMV